MNPRLASTLRRFRWLRPGREKGDRGSARRYFVVVTADSHAELLRLAKLELDLDLFPVTARRASGEEVTIEGLLTLAQVGELVERGYRVLVNEEASKRSRAHEVVSFDEWIRGMSE
jgi:hypothetical protein